MDRVCQFYIVIGEKEFRPPNDGNVYINATGVMDNKLIEDAIYRAFNKKHSEKVQVGSEIIFLVSDINFERRCQEIMQVLNIRGKVQVLPKKLEEKVVEVIEPVVPKVDAVIEVPQNTSVDSPIQEEEVRRDAKIVDMQEYQNRFQNQTNDVNTVNHVNDGKDIAKYSYQPSNHVYYGDLDNSLLQKNTDEDNSYVKDSASYMGYNRNLMDKNVKTLVKKQQRQKSAAFVHLPVIIFVLSALLLIASIILLFVVE